MTQFKPGDLVRRRLASNPNAGVYPGETFIVGSLDKDGWPTRYGAENLGGHLPEYLELIQRAQPVTASNPVRVGDLVVRIEGHLGRQDVFEVATIIDDGATIIDKDGRNHYHGYLARVAVSALDEQPAEEKAPGEDVVNHPSHYKAGKFEAIEVIEAFDLNRDFRLGNAAKYLLRAGKKADELEDLKKAAKYLSRYIAELETGTPAW